MDTTETTTDQDKLAELAIIESAPAKLRRVILLVEALLASERVGGWWIKIPERGWAEDWLQKDLDALVDQGLMEKKELTGTDLYKVTPSGKSAVETISRLIHAGVFMMTGGVSKDPPGETPERTLE